MPGFDVRKLHQHAGLSIHTNNVQVAKYGLEALDASGGRLGFLPEEIRERPEMACLTDVNLSRNQLFNSDHVFGILSCLKALR